MLKCKEHTYISVNNTRKKEQTNINMLLQQIDYLLFWSSTKIINFLRCSWVIDIKSVIIIKYIFFSRQYFYILYINSFLMFVCPHGKWCILSSLIFYLIYPLINIDLIKQNSSRCKKWFKKRILSIICNILLYFERNLLSETMYQIKTINPVRK